MIIAKYLIDLPEGPGVIRGVGLLSGRARKITRGPVPGGRFWAVNARNDLPLFSPCRMAVHMGWPEFFARYRRVWYRDVNDGRWIAVTSEEELPGIARKDVRHFDPERGWETRIQFDPLIELYAVR